MREGLTSQGLRGSGWVGCWPASLSAAGQTHDTSPPAVACSSESCESCESSLCYVKYPRTSLTPRHEASRAPMVSAQSLLTHARRMDVRGVFTRAFRTASFQRREISITSQSISRLAPRRHVRTSTHLILLHRLQPHPTLRPPLAYIRRVQPRILPPTHVLL